MASFANRLAQDAFERLRDQMTVAAALCSDDQVLELADDLHDALRRRRSRRFEDRLGHRVERRSFADPVRPASG